MHAWSLIPLIVCVGCAVRVPVPGEIGIRVKTTTRVEARVQTAPVVAVPIQGAAVVEFFGVPLEGAQDIVFVLDCSGSMGNLARGRIAQAAAPNPVPVDPVPAEPPAPPPPPPHGADPADPMPVGGASEPAPAPPSDPAVTPSASQPRKIEVAQAELIDALMRLPEGTRMNVLFFNSELEAYAPTMITLDEAARADLISFVRESAATGSTALAPAMRTAFLLNARRIVLLSDGLGNVGGNADAVLRDAREAMRGGVRIDTIGLGKGQHARLLGSLAEESGGLYQPL